MKQGFMLIELIVASLIASMVAAILLAALAQSNRFQMIVDNLVDMSVRVAVVSNQLEKDLMGAFIPVQAKEKESFDKLRTSGEDKKEQKEGEQKGPEKKEEKILEKIFYSTNKNGQFDTLTFITNNPLVVYVGKDVGVVKPKVVRVQYTLKPEVDKKDSYALLRQESMELDLEQYKNITAYEVIGGIKSCTMTFIARIQKKEEKPAAAAPEKTQEKQKISYEYKTLNDWVSEQKKETEKEQTEFPRIPYSIEIKMVLWDIQDKREKEFTIICQIPTDFTESKEDKKEAEQSKKDEKKEDKAGEDKGKQSQTAQNNRESSTETIVVVNGVEKVIGKAEDLMKFFGRM